MAACYTADAHFHDPVFQDLHGAEVGAMWRMLCGRATDLKIVHSKVDADADSGSAHWEADYTFSTGRAVHNVIDAGFKFENGLIADHRDSFDLYAWARQALGPVGVLLGWSPPVQREDPRRRRARAWTSSWPAGPPSAPTAVERPPLGLRHVLAARRAGADPRPRRRDDHRPRASRPPSESWSSTSRRRLALIPRFRQRITSVGTMALSQPGLGRRSALRHRAPRAPGRAAEPGRDGRAARARRPGDVGAARPDPAAVAALPGRGPGGQAATPTSTRPTTRSSTGSPRSTSARSSSTRPRTGTEVEVTEERWEPDEPSPELLFVRDASDRIRAPLRVARKAAREALTMPRSTAGRVMRTAEGFAKLAASGPTAPRTFLNQEIGRDRRVAFVDTELELLKSIRGDLRGDRQRRHPLGRRRRRCGGCSSAAARSCPSTWSRWCR